MKRAKPAADQTPARRPVHGAARRPANGPAHDTGWRMPAEWAPHDATWIAWPHERGDWPGKFATIPWVYTEIVRHLHTGELVHILVNDGVAEARARRQLGVAGVDLERVRFFRIPTDRVWTRDYGPMFVVSAEGGLGINNWRFNGWAKYDNWRRDDKVAARAAMQFGVRHSPAPTRNGFRNTPVVVLEGGSIDVNGSGCLLTTEECLLSGVQERNPGMSRAEYEQAFARYLGVRKVLWLGNGVAGDDTHGHIDDLARFVGPHTVVVAVEANEDDANYRPLQENLERLRGMTDERGRALEVIELPMPAPVVFRGQRLPASYANFYIANDKVLVPTFNDPHDRIALGILADLFLERQVVGIHAVDLVWGLGTLHCMTQQQPAV
ncbi:MAG: agmatine deiminase family protein [Gemmataceae bacterium]|nr:agmatine deiminase family protein [Gemmataceae bacterium]